MARSPLNEWSGFFEADPIEPTKELTEALRGAYPGKTDLTAEQVDTPTIRLPLLKIMSHKADQKAAPVYAYLFTYGNSYHGAEIPYVFHLAGGNEEEQALAEQISQAWGNFARTGTPGAKGMPEWEPYTRESGAAGVMAVSMLAGCKTSGSAPGQAAETQAAETQTAAEAQEKEHTEAETSQAAGNTAETGESREETGEGAAAGAASAENKTLVVYYSASGRTEAVAKVIADAAGADLFVLEPAEPYTSDDLNYSDDNSRVKQGA